MGQHAHCSLQLFAERKGIEGFEHIVKCVDRIPIDRILGQIGDENDHHPGIVLSNLPRHIDAQHIRKLDIQEQQVCIRTILFKQAAAGGIGFHRILKPGMHLLILEQIIIDLPRLVSVIFQNNYFQYASPASRNLTFLYCIISIPDPQSVFKLTG